MGSVINTSYHMNLDFSTDCLWHDNGDLYIVCIIGGDVAVIKSADNGSTWAEQDSAGRPTLAPSVDDALTSYWDPTLKQIHIAVGEGGSGVLGGLEYHVFNTSSAASNKDSWTTIDTNVQGDVAQTIDWVNNWSGITVRSSGDVVITTQVNRERIHGTDYGRIGIFEDTGGGFSNIATLGTGDQNRYLGSKLTLGASGKVHIVFNIVNASSASTFSHASLADGSSTPSSTETIDTSGGTFDGSINIWWLHGHKYRDISGNETILITYPLDVSASTYLGQSTITNDGSPGTPGQIGGNTMENTAANRPGAPLVADVDHPTSARWIAVYANDADQDLYMDQNSGSGWGTDTEIGDAETVENPFGAITWNNAGNWTLGVIWADPSTDDVIWHTYDLGVDVFTPADLTAAASIDAVTLTQTHILTLADLTAAASIDPVTLTLPTNQSAFRIRSETAEENLTGLNVDSDWAAALNGNATIEAGKIFAVRFEVEVPGSLTDSFKLYYRINAGSWAEVGLNSTVGATTPILLIDTARFADGDATTNLLSGSAETFEAGAGQEDNTTASQTLIGEHTEHEYSLKIMGFWDSGEVAHNDTIELQMRLSGGGQLGLYANSPTITVDKSNGFIGGSYVEHPMVLGPFIDGGNLYTVVEPSETDNRIAMVKSSDGGSTWAEIDKAGGPANTDVEGVDIQQDGDTLHIIHHKGAFVYYYTFRTSSHGTNPDTWNLEETIDSGLTSPTVQACAIAVLSNGDIWAFYADNDDTIWYNLRTSGTWQGATDLDAEGATNFVSVHAIVGASNLTHIVYKDHTNGILYHRSLSSGGSLSARESVITGMDTTFNGSKIPFVNLVYYDDGGTEVIMIIYQKTFGNDKLYHKTVRGDGSPGTEVTATDNNVEQGEGGNAMVIASAAVDGKTVYLFYADRPDNDIWYTSNTDESGWDTDTEFIPNVATDWITGNIFTHSAGNGSAKVFGFIWDDGSNGGTGYIWYNELELASTLTVADLTAASSLDAVTLSQTHQLALADLLASSSLDPVSLTQTHILALADLLAAASVDAVTIAQSQNLVIADLLASASLDAVTLTQIHQLVLADLLAVATIDPAIINQTHILAIADLTAAASIDPVTLVQVQQLVLDDLLAATSLDAVTLSQTHVLALADLLAATSLDAVTLTQVHQLALADLLAATSLDPVTLAQIHQLALADLTAAASLDPVTLAQVQQLVIADLLATASLDAVTLSQIHQLVLEDLLAAAQLDAVSLTQTHILAVFDLLASASLDPVTLAQVQQLVIADLLAAASLDAVTLTQVHQLTLADLLAAASIDTAQLDQTHQLTLADLLAAASLDPVTLGAEGTLVVADLLAAASLDPVNLSQTHILALADLLATAQLDAVSLSQLHQLVLSDLTATTTLDPVTLAQVHLLTVADLLAAASLDPVTLAQTHQLTLADLLAAAQLDAVTISQTHILTTDDLTATTTLDPVTLEVGATLVVADLLASVSMDSFTLAQVHQLVLDDLLALSSVDALLLTQLHQLALDDLTASTSLDALTLAQVVALSVADLTASASMDPVALTQVHQLTVDDLAALATIDSLVIVAAGDHNLIVSDMTAQALIDSPILLSAAAEALRLKPRDLSYALKSRQMALRLKDRP